MKCSKCEIENITKANYCKKCGHKFTKKEQQLARSKTLIGKIELLEKAYDVCKLKVITNNIIFKTCLLLIVIGTGIYFWVENGINFKLLNSKNYEVQYNTKLDEYYLITEKDKTALNLYIPNRVKSLDIVHFDTSDNALEEIKYEKEDEIVLEAHSEEYYILETIYNNGSKEKMKIYVLQK